MLLFVNPFEEADALAALITNNDIEYLRSLYPQQKIEYLTGQQEQCLMTFFRGLGIDAAASSAGMEYAQAKRFLDKESTELVLEYLRGREFTSASITREMLNNLLLEAHRKSASATEEIMAIKELGKINGLYESDNKSPRSGVSVTVNNLVNNQPNKGVNQDITMRQIQALPESELLRLAGAGFDFAPDASDISKEVFSDVIDAEWEAQP